MNSIFEVLGRSDKYCDTCTYMSQFTQRSKTLHFVSEKRGPTNISESISPFFLSKSFPNSLIALQDGWWRSLLLHLRPPSSCYPELLGWTERAHYLFASHRQDQLFPANRKAKLEDDLCGKTPEHICGLSTRACQEGSTLEEASLLATPPDASNSRR